MDTGRFHIALQAISAALMAFALTLFCAIASASWYFIDTAHAAETRTVPLLVVVVGFDGSTEGAASTPYSETYDWGATVFGESGSLATYFSDMSHDAFTFAPAPETCSANTIGTANAADREGDGVVHVTLPRPHGDWGLVDKDLAVAQEFGKAALEAYRAAAAYVDFASFDADGDGLLEADELVVCLLVAGYDASSVGDPARADVPLIWPHIGTLTNEGGAEEQAGGVRLESYIALPEQLWYETDPLGSAEQEPLGILYHELGHTLGLPDLYARNADAHNGAWNAWSVGMLSLMDNGAWASIPEGGGYRYEPVALDAWSRFVLGWTTPQVATASGDYLVSSQLSGNGYAPLLIPTTDPDQCFLVENRQPEGHDEALASQYAESNPHGGIVVWHVDKAAWRHYAEADAVNDTTHRPAVMETYFETGASPTGATASTGWAQSLPDTGEPFYDARSCEANLGNADAAVRLPLYGDDSADDNPAARVDSGIELQFPTESARDMTVRVRLPASIDASADATWPATYGTLYQASATPTTWGDAARATLMLAKAIKGALV